MKKGGLQSRLIKFQLIITLLVLTFSWCVITVNDYLVFKRLSIETFETTARILARNLSTCLAFKDQDECQRVLKTISGEKDILSAVVMDSNGNRISSFMKETPIDSTGNLKFLSKDFNLHIQDKTIRLTYPILEAGTLEGRLYIVSKFDLLETFALRHAIFFIFIMIAGAILGIFLSRHLQRKITGQINLILNIIDKIKSEKNYSLRTVNEASSAQIDIEEFEFLSRSFDDMIEQIENRDAKLRTRNQDLKRIVDDKVMELYREKEKAVHNAELASLGEMAGGIAHEINNPLAIIKSSTLTQKKLLSRDQFDRDMFLDCIGDIDTTVERIAKIITGLRNISRRSEDGERAACSFKEIFQDVFSLATVKFNAKGIDIRKNYTEEDLEKTFLANRVQLSQVMVNLLNNAYDAIYEKEEKWIEVKIEFSESLIRLRITDSGGGILPHIREKMFNPFFTTKEVGKGTGIGLSISKSMVEKSGGTFFYDEQSADTCFVVQFPLKVE